MVPMASDLSYGNATTLNPVERPRIMHVTTYPELVVLHREDAVHEMPCMTPAVISSIRVAPKKMSER